MTSTDRRLTGVDSLRGIAALSVFVCHLVAYWSLRDQLPRRIVNLADNGAHGVDLFVVLSGFCLALPVLQKRTESFDIGKFWKRRALRILPPYYVALAFAAVFAMHPTLWSRVVGHRASVGDLVTYGTLTQTLVKGHAGAINGSLWSIALEAQLYLVFPALVLLWRRVSPLTLTLLGAAASVLWLAIPDSMHVGSIGSDLLLPARLVQFVAGVWCADVVLSGRRPEKRTCGLALLAGLIAGISATTLGYEAVTPVIWTAPSVAFLLFAVGANEDAGLLLWTKRLGAVSFSFYLVHQPIILLLAQPAYRLTRNPWGLLGLGMTVAFAIVIGAGTLLARAVEQPSQRLARRVGETGLVLPGGVERAATSSSL